MNGKQEIGKMKKDRSYRKHTLRWRSTNCPFRSASNYGRQRPGHSLQNRAGKSGGKIRQSTQVIEKARL